jgi:hypothetical protein
VPDRLVIDNLKTGVIKANARKVSPSHLRWICG